MYRIKEDKRVIQSAELIASGLSKCLKIKKIDEISVSEIAVASGVSRGTFYRIFDTPIDVLSYTCDTLAEEAVNAYLSLPKDSTEAFHVYLLDFWLKHCDVLEDIFRSGRSEIFQRSLARYSSRSVPSADELFNNVELEYMRATTAAIYCSILYVWVSNGKKETAQELHEMYKGFFRKICGANSANGFSPVSSDGK